MKTLKQIDTASETEVEDYLSRVNVADLRAHVKEIAEDEAKLRDRFAAAALTGIMACPEEGIEWHPDIAAQNAWRQADAIAAARKEGA
jgi:hypothetical protein